MGSACCCFRVKDLDPRENVDTSSHGNSIYHECFFSNLFNKYAGFFSSGQMHGLSSSSQEAASSTPNGAPENTEADTTTCSPRKSRCHSSEEEEDVCPTCLEEYTPENPKIITHCSHSYHLSCIYEWMERSPKCPLCCRVLTFDEAN
ncbi:probable E3 ubiquitin-protein ligase RHB1A [Corylus avellana]|uniref:probable E3 ubiquitin-protein ligase RHB1A n=1 Tax=Corylus avellana TaxID=13451 RepID=UPI00286AA618|nr:probable E3 ubiquitin-protein ligase RHB1A [Corylus avellana]